MAKLDFTQHTLPCKPAILDKQPNVMNGQRTCARGHEGEFLGLVSFIDMKRTVLYVRGMAGGHRGHDYHTVLLLPTRPLP